MMARALFLALLLLKPVDVIAATIVLVHGAFVGSWYWDPVAEGSREMGHAVVAVDLNSGDQGTIENPDDVSLDDLTVYN